MNDENQVNVTYNVPGPVIGAFFKSNAFVRGIMGPVGSGKSTACVIELLARAMGQKPGPDGTRRTRFAIIRNTFPELKTTTLKTWHTWCPAAYGKSVMDSPILHHVKTNEIDMEVLFLALDKEEDARKLLSLELTGAWINEAREVPKAVLDALTGRVGRYPPMMDGGPTWSGIIMDTNPPDQHSWWYKFAEEEKPEGWEFFKQPSGENLDAENIENLRPNYYQTLKPGKSEDWVKVYVHGEYGFVTEGKAVYPPFRDSAHVSPEGIEPIPEIALSIGADFGLTPAAVIGQRLADGRWMILDEVTMDGYGIQRFADHLRSYVARRYPGFQVADCWGDPAGNQRAQTDERTPLDIMAVHTKWRWNPAPTNDLTMRIEVVMSALGRMIDGSPGFLLSPKCERLRKGFAGGYHYRTIKRGFSEITQEIPNKNEYSHVHDALQYLLLGGGEAGVVLNKYRPRKPGESRIRIAKDVDYDLFDY